MGSRNRSHGSELLPCNVTPAPIPAKSKPRFRLDPSGAVGAVRSRRSRSEPSGAASR
uniref:Uncharacterized protein n=1 Tax=Anopheles minimus TaxID=112268 RepID=A0A182WNA2_9DIPT